MRGAPLFGHRLHTYVALLLPPRSETAKGVFGFMARSLVAFRPDIITPREVLKDGSPAASRLLGPIAVNESH